MNLSDNNRRIHLHALLPVCLTLNMYVSCLLLSWLLVAWLIMICYDIMHHAFWFFVCFLFVVVFLHLYFAFVYMFTWYVNTPSGNDIWINLKDLIISYIIFYPCLGLFFNTLFDMLAAAVSSAAQNRIVLVISIIIEYQK